MKSKDLGGVNLSEWALGHQPLMFFLMIVCITAGSLAYLGLGRSEDPTFTVKVMLVKAIWPGATTTETLNLVTDKLERKLEEVPHLDFLRSETKAGETTIYVRIKQSVSPTQVPDIWYQVRKKVLDAWHSLPRGAQGPFFNDEFGDTFGIIYAALGDGFTHREMRDEMQKIRARLLRVPDVSKVELLGLQDEKIYIEASIGTVSNLGIDVVDVVRAIQAPNLVIPAGMITTENERIIIRMSGAYENEEDLRQINLHTPAGFVRLGDFATIARRYADPPTPMFRFAGQPAIGIAVSMAADGDILKLGKAIKREIADIQANLPIGLDLYLVMDQAEVVVKAVRGFTRALFEAVAIILAVGFLALGLRAGLVVAVAIPLVLAATFTVMSLMGIALQRVSLGALIVSLGLLVDDAMITVEMMISKLEEQMDRMRAASFAYTSTAFPMLTGTLVTAAGFIPVGFARSDAGEYSNSLFWVVTIALLASWVVAILFSPVIGVHVLPKTITKAGHARSQASQLFRGALLFSLRRRYFVIASTIGLFCASVWGASHLQYQFFPASDRPELVLAMTLPQSASMYATQQTVDQVEKLLSDDSDIEYWSFYVGSGPVRFYLPLEPPLPNEFIAQAVIMTKGKARDRVRARLASIMHEQFPEVVSRISPLELGPPVGWPVKYRVSGEDLSQLRQLAFETAKIIDSDPHVRDVNFDWNETIKVVRLELYQEKAKQVGLTADVLARALNGILAGTVVTHVRDVTYLVEVIGRSIRSERMDLATLRDLHVRGPSGLSVPIGAIARLEYTEDQPVIWRRKRLPTITIQADLVGAQASAVVRSLEPKMDRLRSNLPAGYSIETGGIFEDSARALSSLGTVVPAMVIAMLVVLMIQLQSFQRLFLVVSVAPLGLIGVVLAMLASGTPVGFIAIIGVIALTGILIRNSVILIDQIEANIESGQGAWDAVLDATTQRVRPILLTAGAAMLGMVPIALDVFWGPMAYAMIGGIGVASLLTLVFVPALYVAWFNVREPRATHPYGE